MTYTNAIHAAHPREPRYLSGKVTTGLATLALGVSLLLPLAAQCATTVPNANAGGVSTPSFTLPTQLRAQYTGVGKFGKMPLSGAGAITWNTKTDGNALLYDAGIDIGALFYKSTVQSSGTVNASGIHPLRTEEKNTGKTATVINIDPKTKQVSITGKDGSVPYDATGQDLLTVIAQLGTFIQTQPKWRIAGEQKTFNVYRPSGLKQWRFQSQGMQDVVINGVPIATVHAIQIPLEAGQALEEQHHFWLDPARHGFPVKLRKVKSDTEYVELTLKDWQEQ